MDLALIDPVRVPDSLFKFIGQLRHDGMLNKDVIVPTLPCQQDFIDPATCNWTLTEAMTTDRLSHTATLLPNGLVLVAGGQVALPNISTRSAELYDPATGMWTPTGSMQQTARFAHSATRLLDGQVLIAEGTVGGSVHVASAELYDPNTGTFTPTGPLNIARSGHAATLLPDGRVLVVGGAAGSDEVSGHLDSAELYDPDTGAWSLLVNLMMFGRDGARYVAA